MYRYARGQSGGARQVSLGRGYSGARTASPEPGGGFGSEPTKERQDEVILQLENELIELRKNLAWKDQCIASLSRTDTIAARLKRDTRQLVSELHLARKQLRENNAEVQDLNGRLNQLDGNSASAPSTRPGDSGACNGAASREHETLLKDLNALSEENRQLRETVMQMKAQTSRPNGTAISVGVEIAGGSSASIGINGGVSLIRGAEAAVSLHDVSQQQRVYSSLHPENTSTLGIAMLQGVGKVDGSPSVARVLLQRVQSSACYAPHLRPAGVAAQ